MSQTQSKNKRADGETFFQAYERVLKQKMAIDHLVFKMETRLVRFVQRSQRKSTSHRKTYVDRVDNSSTLVEAIRKSMVPNKNMTMKQILKSLSEMGHATNSGYFYTMVNNKLNRDKKHIEKISRGVFRLIAKKTPKKSRTRHKKETQVAA